MSKPVPQLSPASPQPPIRASELSQYAFCHKAWWLGTVRAHRPQAAHLEALERGERHHQQHGTRVRQILHKRKAGLTLLAVGSGLLVLAVLITLVGGIG